MDWKKLLPAALLLNAVLVGAAEIPPPSGRTAPGPVPDALATLTLNGEWRFQIAPDAKAASALASFHEATFDSSAFKTIAVPGCWPMLGFEDPYYVNGTESEGFYLHRFNVPQSVAGQRVLLHFGGVWQSAEVWLNGERVGRHDSGFTSFAFDISALVKAGGENRIAVRVTQRGVGWKFDTNDDWALPGIYRDVWLEFSPKELFIENVEVGTKFDAAYRDAVLNVRAFVARNANADFFAPSPPFEVRAILSTREGEEVQRTSFTGVITGSRNGRDVALALPVRAPAQWTAETPNLYELRVELWRDGALAHTWRDRVGIRDVSTAGGVLRVNGTPIKIRGVCRHDEQPDRGRATTPERWRAEIELMKAGNINAVRTSHYPPAEGFVRLCDELGLYVIEEIPFGFGGDRMNDPILAEGAFLRMYETVARDRNRPSIIVWSLGNEDPFTTLHLGVLRSLKGLDGSRPVLLPFRAEEGLPPEVDILAPHYWTAQEYDKRAANADRPIITTEYSHALGPDDFGGEQDRWDALTRHPAGAGGAIWLWADQGLYRPVNGRPVLDPMRDKPRYTREGAEMVRNADGPNGSIVDAHGNLGTDGIVDPDLKPQIDYWETKAVYSPVRIVGDEVPFAKGQESVAVRVRNFYDFTDLSTVSATWKLFRDAELIAEGKASLSGAPHTETTLVIPTTTIKATAPDGVYYAHVSFTDATGRELTRNSVRLGVPTIPVPVALATRERATATRKGDVLTVTAGELRYAFDATTGEIATIDWAGTRVAQGSSIVVWRYSTWSERNQLDRRKVTHDWDVWLQKMTATARNFEFTETPEGVRVSATTSYHEDAANNVEVNYTYLVTPAGALQISYEVKPRIELDWLPEIGIELRGASAVRALTWVGYGPRDSLPNRRATALFGQWSAAANAAEAMGTKTEFELLRISLDSGKSLRLLGAAGFRLEPGTESRMRLLSHVQGAWVKGGLPDRPEWRLDLKDGRSFTGTLRLIPEKQ